MAPNRLAHETSPYLRQHAGNPVDWYPWGEEALTRARTENKPILLSVGYSACHWCHVMEHESFENPQIAALMNDHFVNIKVDREERPDLDQIYQNVAQLITRGGGWPLTVFLTPDLRPFFGGTYFPPEDRYGRAGFGRVLNSLAEAFHKDPEGVSENARKLTDAIRHIETGSAVTERVRPEAGALRKIADSIVAAIDWRNGGFGGAPKFPNSMNLTYLWRYGNATGLGIAQEAASLSLTQMAKGGIYDHLGGGFHRYAVDEHWGVPHFEKMLYDNALLLKLYSEVLVSRYSDLPREEGQLYAKVVRETTRYLLREMKSSTGGFFSTQDADSEGEEGKFFVWDAKDLESVLDQPSVNAVAAHFGVSAPGNFEDTGKTVLRLARSEQEVASQLGMSTEQMRETLAKAKEKLFQAREKRVKPGRDEKILASWNGLAISGLAWASRALQLTGESGDGELSSEAAESARVAMDFARTHFTSTENRLRSVFKDGEAKFNAYLDDYAFLALAALDLSQVLSDRGAIEELIIQSQKWVEVVSKHFKDSENGGYFFTSDDHEKLIQRPKSIFDQAIPSGNAVVIECLLALSELTGEDRFMREADEMLSRLFPNVEKAPFGLGELACSALLYVMGPVAVSGAHAEKLCVHPHVFRKPDVTAHEIQVCHKNTCDMPTTELDSARQLLEKKINLGA